MVLNKQVLSTSGPGPGGEHFANYQFRHERISDFYVHFAFLGDDPSVRFEHVRDDKFGGVYDLLARVLPKDQADELREVFVLTGVDSQNHRQSDSFIQHLRWRRLLENTDPMWISELDPPWGTSALDEFSVSERQRVAIDEKMTALRARSR